LIEILFVRKNSTGVASYFVPSHNKKIGEEEQGIPYHSQDIEVTFIFGCWTFVCTTLIYKFGIIFA